MNSLNNNEQKVPKILLMGLAKVGKTSMRKIIFANKAPRDTSILGYTREINESKINFMGNMTLNLLDCGGQSQDITQYFESKKEQVFSNVQVLIFVIEAQRVVEVNKQTDKNEDLIYFEK